MATTTLSSVGVSGAIILDWMGAKPVTANITLGSTTMGADYTLQYTIDDIMNVSSPTWIGWTGTVGSSITHFSSAHGDAGVTISFLNPIAALRVSSTAISSSSITLKVLQGVGG